MKPEHDVYIDSCRIQVTPYAAILTGALSDPDASGPSAPTEDVLRVRTSLEHWKVLLFTAVRDLRAFEHEMGQHVAVPSRLLNQLRIGPEDWQSFWGEPPKR